MYRLFEEVCRYIFLFKRACIQLELYSVNSTVRLYTSAKTRYMPFRLLATMELKKPGIAPCCYKPFLD